MLGWGFGIGTQIIIARRFGENKISQISVVWQHSIFIQFLMALTIVAVVLNLSPYLLEGIINSKQVLIGSIEYLDIRAWGLIFAFINVTFRAFYVGVARTKVISWTTAVVALYFAIQ